MSQVHTRGFAYPVRLEADKEGYTVTFPDLASVVTWGSNKAEALDMAADALNLDLSERVRNREDLPLPSKGTPRVSPTAQVAIKAAIYLAMRDGNIGQAEFARQLKVDPKDVRRLLDPRYNSRLDRLEAAAAALGRKIVVESQAM